MKQVDIPLLWEKLHKKLTAEEALACIEQLDQLVKKQVVWKGHDVESWQVYRDKLRRKVFE